jgi:hypothetical protein
VRFKALPQRLIAIVLLTGCVNNQQAVLTDHDFEVVVRKKEACDTFNNTRAGLSDKELKVVGSKSLKFFITLADLDSRYIPQADMVAAISTTDFNLLDSPAAVKGLDYVAQISFFCSF